VLATLVVPIAAAQIVLVNDQSTGSFDPVEVDVGFGKILDGTTVGDNATNASLSISGTLSLTTEDALYINNIDSSREHYVKLVHVSSSNVGNLGTFELGIDNGTKTTQILIDAGSLTQSEGSSVRLPADSTNTIYAKDDLTALSSATLTFRMYSADSFSGDTYVISRGTVDITV